MRPGDHDPGHLGRVRREARLEPVGVGEPPGLQRAVDLRGQLGFAVLLVGQRQEGDREPTGLALGEPLQGSLEAAPVGLAREQGVAVDQMP